MEEKVSRISQWVLRERTPNFLSLEIIQEREPLYNLRRKLRESLDTRAGSVYLQSNIVAVLPFVVAGVPAAEAAQDWIDPKIEEAPEVVRYAVNSLATLLTQLTVGYTTL